MPVSLIRVKHKGHPKNKDDRTWLLPVAHWSDVIDALREGETTELGTLFWKYKVWRSDEPECPKDRIHARRWVKVKCGGDKVRRFMVCIEQWPLVYQECRKDYYWRQHEYDEQDRRMRSFHYGINYREYMAYFCDRNVRRSRTKIGSK